VDKFIVEELYTNDVLVSQNWSVKGGFETTHPTAYEPKYMKFGYYEDTSFLNSDECSNYLDYYKLIPKPSMILDWNKLESLDNILSISLPMDGNIYRINDPNPIPLWRHEDYIGSFYNDAYDLDQVVKVLSKKNWIRNIEIIEIPYYNRDDNQIFAVPSRRFGPTHAVEFDYKLPSKKCLGKRLTKNKLFANHYFS
jgi:hypothetical protein